VGAALADPRAVCELILDGHHLHPAAARVALAAKGPDRIALITDAIAAAGSTRADLTLGDRVVAVRDGVARLADGGALAGSTLTMDRALRAAVDLGATVADASRMASATPARVLGLEHEVGTIEAGRWADLVVLDHDLRVVAVVHRGRVVHGER
jgi:N-acetylglucosamine-6-phosphate deacetylase